MKIRTLRIIDLWIGRPVCWLITGLHLISRTFKRNTPAGPPKKILFIKLFGAGSIVLAYPTVRAVKDRFPEAELYFLTFSANRQVIRALGLIPDSHVYTVRNDTITSLAVDIAGCLVKLIREKLDVTIDLEFFSRFTAILSFALRSRLRIGFYGFYTEGLRRGRFITARINYNHTLHTAKAFFTLLGPLGITSESYDPTLPHLLPGPYYPGNILALLAEESGLPVEDADLWLAINPNTSDLIELRRWPASHFTDLCLRLLDGFPDYGLVFIGSREERRYNDALIAQVRQQRPGARLANLAGRTDLAQLHDLLHRVDLFITNDSGPAHLAALAGTRTISLFGPESPALYAPLNPNCTCLYLGLDCQPCITIYNGKRSHCHDNQCLKQLTVWQVFETASKFLPATEVELVSSSPLLRNGANAPPDYGAS